MAAVIHITDMLHVIYFTDNCVHCWSAIIQSRAVHYKLRFWWLYMQNIHFVVHVNAVIQDNPQLFLTSLSSVLTSGQASSSNISLINLLTLLVRNFCSNQRHQLSKLIMNGRFQHNKAAKLSLWFSAEWSVCKTRVIMQVNMSVSVNA